MLPNYTFPDIALCLHYRKLVEELLQTMEETGSEIE